MIAALIPLMEILYRSALYFTALKVGKLEPRGMTSVMCGGAPVLAGLIPMPPFIHLSVAIAAASYFISHNCGEEIYPETLGIVGAVEVIHAFSFGYAVLQLVEQIL